MFLLVRTAAAPEKLAPEIQTAIRALDPNEAIANVRTMDDAIESVAPRFNVQLLDGRGCVHSASPSDLRRPGLDEF
jgi:hypothetical protein